MAIKESVGALTISPAVRLLMDRRDVIHLIELLDDAAIRDGVAVRAQAVQALGEMGAIDAVEPISRLLASDERLEVRACAAVALGKIDSPAVVAPLIEGLGDEHYAVRVHAAESLGRAGQSEALPALRQALNDSSWPVQTNAAKALGRLKTDAAIPALVDAALSKRFSVRLYAIEAIGEIGGPSGSDALIELRRRIRNPFVRRIIRNEQRALNHRQAS